MKTTFVATVFNEEKSIKEFVDSIMNQAKMPDEIIIVDAGSKDKTKKIIESYKKILVLTKKGNRSIGRNYGIANSKGDIIIVSDAGCILDMDFIKEITSPFRDKKIDIVSGYYYPITYSVFEICLATYTCVMPDKLDPNNFLPSSRSIAFKKSSWEKIGGYPEHLDTCEDLIFADRLKKAGFKFKFVKKAFVNWRQQDNIFKAFLQFYNYALGDGEAHYFRPQTPFLFSRYTLALIILSTAIYTGITNFTILLILFLILYLIWSVHKNYKYINNPRAVLYLPLLQLTSDLAVLTGMSFGLIKSIIRK